MTDTFVFGIVVDELLKGIIHYSIFQVMRVQVLLHVEKKIGYWRDIHILHKYIVV